VEASAAARRGVLRGRYGEAGAADWENHCKDDNVPNMHARDLGKRGAEGAEERDVVCEACGATSWNGKRDGEPGGDTRRQG
jgi:hypothetical protein